MSAGGASHRRKASAWKTGERREVARQHLGLRPTERVGHGAVSVTQAGRRYGPTFGGVSQLPADAVVGRPDAVEPFHRLEACRRVTYERVSDTAKCLADAGHARARLLVEADLAET